MSQQYSLRWNNHQPNFISMFTSLLNTQTLVDVTLAAEGKQLKAHKVVLSACSTYFQSLFVDNPSRHPIVILKDVTFADLRTMVDFMYCGEVNVTEEQLPKVLDTAKLLKIKGLTEMPESTSLTRSQGTSSDFQSCTSADFQSPRESSESQRHSVSPVLSNSHKRKRRRMSSGGSGQLNLMPEENRGDENAAQVEIMRGPNDTVTMRSVPQPRDLDTQHQANEQQNLNVEPMAIDTTNNSVISQGQWSMMEHTYPRYSNACLNNSGLQPDQMYMNNALNTHMSGGDMSDYGQGIGVVGPSPGGGGGGGGVGCVEPQGTPDQSQIHVPKRRRTSNPQSAENFQRALEAVRFGGIGFCKAARMFGVNNRTLWLEYKKKGYPTIRPSIKSRIKKEQTSPPRELKQEMNQPEQQMALICPPHPVPVNFIDSRSIEFPLQTVSHSSTINILGVNFNSMQ